MRLKKKEKASQRRIEKIVLSGKTLLCLDNYARYYEETYKEKIKSSDLMVEMLAAFMQSDRDFLKWSKENPLQKNLET